ncbi:MATE family efflux transporter [Parabacteroides bouchesdurhonensis]|uniref:MATE family efflux transporter n=1 Tax=Parabacteroides bouchesdurhonensis TaxID=1936995 RepID=UPI000C82269E|nr:MATE family efflux transporter [Parabacteroides bouchesdurhonensis]
MNKKILQLAIPSIISNITVPLLGLIDVTIVGHLGSAAYIGAIAVGGLLFNIIYWSFGFLRMGTSGMTSQAYGKRDMEEAVNVLVRAVSVGFSVAALLFILQYPIERIAFHLLDTSTEVQRLATIYFRICIWGAPAVLGLYGFVGWFIGMQNSRFPMVIAIVQNVLNICFSLFFVFVCHMKVEGVALGTLLAQYGGLLLAVFLWLRYYKKLTVKLHFKQSLQYPAMRRFFSVNGDIFFRTLCLIAVTAFFTSTGAKHGDVVLAVNTLLMQLFTLFSYIMDGFAYAGEALSGRYIGARNEVLFRRAVRLLFYWGTGLALSFTLLYGIGGEGFLSLLTNNRDVIIEANTYFYWVLAIPLAGFSAFLWDGIFIGATVTRPMLYSMFMAMASFFGIYYMLETNLGNHALWLAFLTYLLLRGLLLAAWFRYSKRFAFGN